MDHQGSGNNSDQEGEEDEFRRPGFPAEHWLASGHSQICEGLEARKTTPPGSPAQSKENPPAEAPAEGSGLEAIRRRGMGRYNLRSRTTPPERLKDYVCE
ncbi:hypothetical protein NDU88_000506 [Pleurodeles waltl]|uniref:Uncharacterized protein n=1 Tax=Pleurodeles waltl TaxID=8319 RepID=A0AAV7V5A2_PLEWA|nr:hypothetical protein NDU88_000506 [Pleurodeles waltl]